MKLHRPAGLAAGLACLAALLAAPALAVAQADITMRVEGKETTLVEERAMTVTPGAVAKGGNPPCEGTTAMQALDQAVGGDWDGPWYGSTYGVERIRGESYRFNETPDGWTYWVNNREPSVGMCDFPLQDGDEVLLMVSRCEVDANWNCTNPPVLPLELRIPGAARAGAPVEATVVRYDKQGDTAPVEGARIAGPGVDVTTDAAGRASVRLDQPGEIRLKAGKPGLVRSAAEVVRVSAAEAPPATPAAPDRSAPAARVLGIREKQRFSRRRAPRTLRGTVAPDPSGLRAVKLSLTRSAGGRCQLYSPTRERFRGSRCGRRVNFAIGDRQDWSYLLPKRLGKGRYVLDVTAVDKLGNRDRLARGRNRVVFFVR